MKNHQVLLGNTGYEESRRMVAAIADTKHIVESMQAVFDPGSAKYNFFFIVEHLRADTPVDVEGIIERFKELMALSQGIIPPPKKEEKEKEKEEENGGV